MPLEQIATVDWTQTYALMGVMVALAGIFSTLMFWIITKLDSDIKQICNRLDQHIASANARTDEMNARTDQLYQMFIDLLKKDK